MGNLVDSILFQPPPASRLKENKLIWLRTSRGHRIPAFHIEYTSNSKSSTPPITLLYSHANAEDLGCIYPWCKYLSRQLKVNIFAYDYTGYGLATEEGKPNEVQCYADIDAAYDYLRLRLFIPAAQIVLYGRSLGSGPSCYLAAETSVAKDEDTVGGLILHAPFLSVFRIVLESGCTLMGDQFPNVDYIPNVTAPTLLIHGKVDKVVPCHHSKALYDNLQHGSRTPPLFIDDMGHNNVQLVVRDIFLDHLNDYLDQYVRARIYKKLQKPKGGRNTKSIIRLSPR
jgi:fermentation-respiration switch protein FrsA (DUF1100 family)|eukprot:scaffold765_cov151-Chaetoceros_neogracile.AAC.17